MNISNCSLWSGPTTHYYTASKTHSTGGVDVTYACRSGSTEYRNYADPASPCSAFAYAQARGVAPTVGPDSRAGMCSLGTTPQKKKPVYAGVDTSAYALPQICLAGAMRAMLTPSARSAPACAGVWGRCGVPCECCTVFRLNFTQHTPGDKSFRHV